MIFSFDGKTVKTSIYKLTVTVPFIIYYLL